MFNQKKTDQLTKMYSIYSKEDTTLKYIIAQMEPYIIQEGTKLVNEKHNKEPVKVQGKPTGQFKETVDPIKFTESLLGFKKQINDLIEFSFKNDRKFEKARDQSFQSFMNTCKDTAYNFALYCDQEMKKGLKQLSDQQID